ncbi:MAG: tyrosine-type recombinase/integrase [Prochloraceae cyanobacterium]|nr:tyrosine-type recombinase/integrase [Prochloraceae cyanobacterium]
MSTSIDLYHHDLSLPRPFSKILSSEIANGNASPDTVKTYRQQFKLFASWCDRQRLDITQLGENQIKEYRGYLVAQGLKVATIALKLTVIRRIFDIAVARGILPVNPALRVKPPTERRDPATRNNYLELDEAQQLVNSLPTGSSVKELRDRLLVVLMVVQGCRQIELYRLNVGDVIRRKDKVGIRVRGKGSIRVVPLKADVANLLALYIKARKSSGEKLKPSRAMFISFSPNVAGKLENRLTRTSMQRIVNHYLEAARLKHSENRTVTTHGLRHTVGYLLQTAGKPLRVIQEFLGHADPRTTAIYAHIASLWSDNPVTSINIFV